MKEEWEPVRKVRAHEQVIAEVERRIVSGALRPGDKLPSERELAQVLQVSRPSLREALRVLEGLGLVEVRRGGHEGGSFLAESAGSGVANLLRLELALGHFSDRDVLQTRLALETWVCGEAARRGDDPALAPLDHVLERMDDPEVPAQEFNRLDAAFHVGIARATGNVLTAHLMDSLRTAIERQMVAAYDRLPDWRRTARTVRAEHRAILAAVRSGDPERAQDLISRHIREFWELAAR
ncbi:FadR/GntR family transcriptional regulator [Kineococcus sp. SYSU DK004]|uniref:FadR/GntR family transcriptional regulator n=1 Tax=Kineococcus sp. SYSU DK004 TaxID=3383125 RepID=UPI003D7CDA8E